MLDFVIDIKEDTIEAIKNIKKDPVRSLGQLIPLLVVVVATIGFIVAYIMFIVNGGYAKQVDLFRENGIRDVLKMFTWGTIGIITKGFLPILEGIFLIMECALIIIIFFQNESKLKRIFLVIDAAIGGSVTGFLLFCNSLSLSKAKAVLGETLAASIQKLFIPLLIVVLLTIIVFCVLLLFSECRKIILYALITVGIVYLGSPVLLLALENIIPLIAVIIVVAIGGIIMLIGVGGNSQSEGNTNTSSSVGNALKSTTSPTTSSSTSPTTSSATMKQEQPSKVNADAGIRKYELTGDLQLWVERDAFGAEIINGYRPWNGEYTQQIHWGLVARVGLYEFKKGTVEIYINKRRATERDLYYRRYS